MPIRFDLVIKNGLVVTPEKVQRADIGVSRGVIRALEASGLLQGRVQVDVEGCYVLPGLVDPHTHPVYLDDLGGISRTAAFGGVTTLAHYAYAKPGSSLLDTLRRFRAEGEEKSCLDFCLHGGLFETLKQSEEIPKAFSLGVSSFKMFMAYAKLGWNTDDYAMTKAMDAIGKRQGMACIHAENGLAIDYIMDRLIASKANLAARFQETSPAIAEAEGIFRAVSIGRLMSCPVYIPHLSSAEAVEVVRYLRRRRFWVAAETCPQYLALTWNEIKARGPLGKVGPSIKNEEDQDALWQGIREGLIDCIGSDHAPKDKKEKDDFAAAAYGSPQIETMLPIVWDRGVNRGLITPSDLVRLTSENPARVLGLYPRKGRIERGADADLVVFDPLREWTVTASNQHTQAPYTLFEGRRLLGRVSRVYSRGKLVVEEDQFHGEAGWGRFLPTRAGRWQPQAPGGRR